MPHCKSRIPKKKPRGMTNNVGLAFSVGQALYHGYKLVLSKTIRIGDKISYLV
jgi:hypothetical protein